MYWDKVLREVLNKNTSTLEYKVTNVAQQYNDKNVKSNKTLYQERKKNYGLGPKYNDAYFTKREAECMMLLLKGKTINKTAVALSLSPRTIEFYLKNMKAKVRCRTKFELIESVLESNFLQNIDFV